MNNLNGVIKTKATERNTKLCQTRKSDFGHSFDCIYVDVIIMITIGSVFYHL